MDDFFSVPLGTVAPDEPEESVENSTFPADIDEHRGKWVALRAGKIVAVRDTAKELRQQFSDQHLGVTFFHVPASPLILR
jgi:Family of unknown function (DUF5678)